MERNADLSARNSEARDDASVDSQYRELSTFPGQPDPTIEGLMTSFDEIHAHKSKVEGLRGMRENIRQGWRAGGKAILGYKLESQVVGTRGGQPLAKSKLVRDPRTFDDVQRYMKGRARGESRRALQAELKTKIHYSTLVYLEDSALTYAGHTVWNRHKEFVDGAYVGAGTGRYRDRSEWEICRDTHEAMITDAEAEAIFVERDKLKRGKSRHRRSNYLLASLVVCKCGARMHGDGGRYRCHDRCGVRSVKRETLDQAVLDAVFTQVINGELLRALKQEVTTVMERQRPDYNHAVAQIRTEILGIERKAKELAGLLTEVRHQRPIIEQIDALEDERASLVVQLEALELVGEPKVARISDMDIEEFAGQWCSNLKGGNMEKRKAVLRGLISAATFDGEVLEVVPNAAG